MCRCNTTRIAKSGKKIGGHNCSMWGDWWPKYNVVRVATRKFLANARTAGYPDGMYFNERATIHRHP